jgi:hypothetical protein
MKAGVMDKSDITNHLGALQGECLMLLRFQLAFNRIVESLNPASGSRSEFVDKLISLKALENDMVIRLCKFDDKRRDVHSFHNLKKCLRGHTNEVEINRQINMFSYAISEVKQLRRNDRLAHLNKGKIDQEYDVRLNVTPAIFNAVNILDLVSEKKCSYNWSDGRYEKYDLRKEVFEKTFKGYK